MALYVTRPRRDEVRIGRGLPSDPTGVDRVYTSRHATQVNSNGGSAIPIYDWLSSKN